MVENDRKTLFLTRRVEDGAVDDDSAACSAAGRRDRYCGAPGERFTHFGLRTAARPRHAHALSSIRMAVAS